MRIGELLSSFPTQRETKAQKLLDGLGTLWRQNPNEKIVVFATYLGTVDLIAREIEQMFPVKVFWYGAAAIMEPRLPLSAAFAKRMGRECWFAQQRAVKGSSRNSHGFYSILTCPGVRWTLSSGSGEFTDMARTLQRRPTDNHRPGCTVQQLLDDDLADNEIACLGCSTAREVTVRQQ